MEDDAPVEDSSDEDVGTEPVVARLQVLVADETERERAFRPARKYAKEVLDSIQHNLTPEAAVHEFRRYADLHGYQLQRIVVTAIVSMPISDWPVSVIVPVDLLPPEV